MWLVIAKVVNEYNAVTHVRIYNTERKECKLMEIGLAGKLAGQISNAGIGFNGMLQFSESGSGIPVISSSGMLLTANSYFVIGVKSNGIVHMTDYSGWMISTTYDNVVKSVGTVANAWVSDGYLTGYFDSDTPMARKVPFIL